MAQPVSIRLFMLLYGVAAMLALAVALYLAKTMTFSFHMTPEAAETLASRIFAIRIAGFLIAMSLMLFVGFQRSRAARGALGLRWLMGVATSLPFLRGIGVVVPLDHGAATIMALALSQLVLEGFAILLLYGEDASDWFQVGYRY